MTGNGRPFQSFVVSRAQALFVPRGRVEIGPFSPPLLPLTGLILAPAEIGPQGLGLPRETLGATLRGGWRVLLFFHPGNIALAPPASSGAVRLRGLGPVVN